MRGLKEYFPQRRKQGELWAQGMVDAVCLLSFQCGDVLIRFLKLEVI